MRGTFPSFDEFVTVAPPWQRPWRSTLSALLVGSCLALLPNSVSPYRPRDAAPLPSPNDTPAVPPTLEVATASSPGPLAVAFARPPSPLPARPKVALSVPGAPRSKHVPVPPPLESIDTAGAENTQLAAQSEPPAAITVFTVAPLARPPVSVKLPDLSAPQLAENEPPVAGTIDASPPERLRPVDIAQVADSEVRSLRVPQLHEPGLAAGGEGTLAVKVAAMQVTPLPPARLRGSDRATLLAEAPTTMTVRIGSSAVGKVDFRMTGAQTIDVQLSGLLDVLSGHYDSAEFARLRGSAAAEAYVSFDKLRALGLNVRYDAVYDELRING